MNHALMEVDAVQKNTLMNAVVANLLAFARRAWRKRWLVTFTSATGVGKTKAVAYAQATLPFPVRVLRCRQVTTKFGLLEFLALKPGEKRTLHGANYQSAADLYELALARFQEENYLLIIDEADRLRASVFECLRDFFDDVRLPMLLVGNEVLNDKINHQHMRLLRRIRARHEQRPLARPEQREMLGFMGYQLGNDEFDFVWKLVGGSPGFAEAILDTGREIAEGQGVKLNLEAIIGASQYFPSLAKRL
jgi:type II secretory pathway predicted ATPase ExeA